MKVAKKDAFGLRRGKSLIVFQSHTPPDYPLRASGFAVTTGASMAECAQEVTFWSSMAAEGAGGEVSNVTPQNFHEHIGGLSRQTLIMIASQQLARLYKMQLHKKHRMQQQ